ncbi:DNA-directed RNA polymerases I, II, and III subunit RPABC3 [Fusarium oxysporum f. sp. albedinis]|nr:DNA-directed RNA polymerases I, II, and III subunit RPABC3 [Fusarium oxysporum f. sp. albedinis]
MPFGPLNETVSEQYSIPASQRNRSNPPCVFVFVPFPPYHLINSLILNHQLSYCAVRNNPINSTPNPLPVSCLRRILFNIVSSSRRSRYRQSRNIINFAQLGIHPISQHHETSHNVRNSSSNADCGILIKKNIRDGSNKLRQLISNLLRLYRRCCTCQN